MHLAPFSQYCTEMKQSNSEREIHLRCCESHIVEYIYIYFKNLIHINKLHEFKIKKLKMLKTFKKNCLW